jgi:RNA polymerase sigma-70 factor, ECF subfamily
VRSEPGSGRPEESDSDLVAATRRGELSAFDVLVTRHARRAFSVAYRVMGHPQDAEDLVQDAFIAALVKIDTFQAGRSFDAWFYRILVNRGLDLRKARKRRETEEIPESSPAPCPSPLDTLESSELRHDLRLALARLPETQRLLFQLYDLEGFSGPEIAEMLDLPEGTARWHLHRARKALRDALAQHSRRVS